MGIEDVRLSVHRIVEFSLQISHRFLKNHPYVSGVLLFFFLSYTFLPFIISFLLYFFPFFFFILILLNFFWTSEQYNIRDEKHERLLKSFDKDICIDRNARTQASRRRNSKERNEGWDSQAGWEEKNMVSWTSPAAISVQKASSIEETLKEISEDIDKQGFSSDNASVAENIIQVQKTYRPIMRSEPSMSDLFSFEGSNPQTHKSSCNYESVTESSEEAEEEEEEEEEEEAQEIGDKAVKWTEDDQQNLMDLGISEIERNRRLESLIAKRRGRKLIHGLLEEDDRIPSSQIAKVSVTKQYSPFDIPNSLEEMEGLPVPCSAPSVLLPMRNPFDLPYDPLEEKPNLMADSFHQEYTAANQKELSYCRHESFCFGPSFPPELKSIPFSGTQKWAYDGLGYSRFRRPYDSEKGDREWLIENITGREMPNTQSNEELQGKNRELHPQESTSDTSSSSSSENLEEIFNGDRAGVPTMNNAARQSLTCTTQSSRTIKDHPYDFCPSASNRHKIDDFSFAVKAACHTPTYSIASDLQVEVSEISSPPMTFNGTNSATDEESLTYDGDIEKETSLGGDEIWESSDFNRGVDFWETDQRSNAFAAVRDPVDHPEKSNTASNDDIINQEMAEDGDGVGRKNKSCNSVFEKPNDYGSSENSSESDKILNLIKEREKPQPSEDEESTVENGDSELHKIFGESIVSCEQLVLDVEEVDSISSSSASPKSIQQERISIHPIETEMEYKVQSSSSDEEASPSTRTENHLVEVEIHYSGNSKEELMDRVSDPPQSSEGDETAEDVDIKEDENKDVKDLSKLVEEFGHESEKLMGYEADLDPTTPTVRRKTSFPANTSGEVKLVQEKLTPGGSGVLSVAEEAESDSLEAEHKGPDEDEDEDDDEEETDSVVRKHTAEQEKMPAMGENNIELKEDGKMKQAEKDEIMFQNL